MRGSETAWSKPWSKWVSGILCGIVVAGCTPVDPTPTPTSEATEPQCTVAPDHPLPVVTTVQTRDHEITVHAGEGELRFTVSLAGGVLLGHQLTEGQFEQSFPGLHQRYSSAFAGDQTWLDASVDRPLGTPAAVVHEPGLH